MRILRYPVLGSSTWIQEDRLTIGGEAANSAVAFSAWGLRTLLLGTVLGPDDRADWLTVRLSELMQIDISCLTRAPDADTPYCLIMATPDGERTMFGRYFDKMRGQPVTELPNGRVFTLDPYCGANAVQAVRTAKSQGMYVVAMDVVGRPDIAEHADIVVTSHEEIAHGASESDLTRHGRSAARDLRRTLILTLGERGSVAFGPDGELLHRQMAVSVKTPLDATGCGDIYRAGLVCGAVYGWDMKESMEFASAAAAYNLLGMGGGGCVRTIEETQAAARRGCIDG